MSKYVCIIMSLYTLNKFNKYCLICTSLSRIGFCGSSTNGTHLYILSPMLSNVTLKAVLVSSKIEQLEKIIRTRASLTNKSKSY